MNGLFYVKQYYKINNVHLTDALEKEVVNDMIIFMLLKLLIIKKSDYCEVGNCVLRLI
jgi:hypothetical protein